MSAISVYLRDSARLCIKTLSDPSPLWFGCDYAALSGLWYTWNRGKKLLAINDASSIQDKTQQRGRLFLYKPLWWCYNVVTFIHQRRDICTRCTIHASHFSKCACIFSSYSLAENLTTLCAISIDRSLISIVQNLLIMSLVADRGDTSFVSNLGSHYSASRRKASANMRRAKSRLRYQPRHRDRCCFYVFIDKW